MKIIPVADIHQKLYSDEKMEHLFNTIILRDTLNKISKSQIFYLGLLNLQYCHVDYVSGISILTNLKITNSLPLFKAKTKDRLIKLKDISIYFQE